VIFVTDDDKDDWWLAVESGGTKRIGPRPELVEELRREGKVQSFYMYSSDGFAHRFSELLNVTIHAKTVEQVADVKETLSEVLSVPCPSCDKPATIRLGVLPGASAFQRCEGCQTRFHIHRGADNEILTKKWGAGRPAIHRVEAVCPKCGKTVTANIRDDDDATERYCMNCYSLLTIEASGRVLKIEPSSPTPRLPR